MDHNYSIPRAYRSTIEERASIIKMYYRGVSIDQIVRMTGRHRSTIYRILQRFVDEDRISDRKSPGRPRQYDLTDVIRSYLEENPFARNLDAMRELGIQCSQRTFSRLCKELDLKSYIASSKFGLRDFHHSDRLSWCLEREDWGREDWRAVVFSDEFPFTNSTKAQKRVRRKRGLRNSQEYVQLYQPKTASVSFHGYITYDGVGVLTPITSSLDSETYCHGILEPAFEWLDDHLDYYWLWQQDNCPIHVSAWSIEYLTRNMRYPHQILDWPARSPDLNIIEIRLGDDW